VYELYNNKFQEEIKMRTQKLNNLQKIQNSFGRREKSENEKTRKRENVKVRTISFSRFRVFTFSIFLFLLVILLTLSSLSATFAELIPITLKHDDYVTSVSFSPDGKLLATGTNFLVSMDIMASADNKRGDSQCP
jgi:WD40 repeat protein